MPLGTNQATNYLANNPDLVQYYNENIAGTPEEANYIGQGGNQSAFLGFASAHYDMAGQREIAENKRPAGSLNPIVTPTGGGTTGGGTTGGGTTGGGTTTFNLADIPPPDLTPVTSRIGTPRTGQADTLMGQTAGLAAGQQGIRDVVDPLGEQVTGLETSIGTAAKGQAPTLMGQTAGLATGQAGIQAGIGTAGEGQTDLFAGQAGIQAGIGQAGEGQTDLFAGQAGLAGGQATLSENQAALQAGQTGLGEQIGALGTAAVTNEQGEVTQKPTGLFAGQAGLMAGQTGLTQDISGLGRELSDVSADIGGQLTGLGGQLGAFRSGVEQYQRGATTQRGDIQGTQRAGQANLLAQIQGVGQQANRAAEAIAQQRQMQTQTQQPAVQQQAAQFARSAPRATPSNQQVGPMGPMASDPRDVLIQNLLRNASLMNRRPV